MYNLEEKIKKINSDLKSKLATESETRTKEMEGVKRDMARIPRGGGGGGGAPVVMVI